MPNVSTSYSEDGMREKANSEKVSEDFFDELEGKLADRLDVVNGAKWSEAMQIIADALESFAREAVADFRKNKWIISEYPKEARKDALEKIAAQSNKWNYGDVDVCGVAKEALKDNK